MANAQLHPVLRQVRSLCETQADAEASDAQLLERFTACRDEAAFAALVRRHGPMVWGVSRRVLYRPEDAEDVFQATFLVLAKKASSIRKREAVASWLHGVAHRLALRARAQGALRQAHERRAADMRDKRPTPTAWQEVQAVLDTALQELPEKYRAALVLCQLEGQTLAEAAQVLGCPPATVGTRVARGRKLLRDRLARHGLDLSLAGLSALLLASAAPAAAPAALVRATLKAALPFAAGTEAVQLCSAQVAGLVEGGLQTMFLTKTKAALALLLAACLLAGAAALTHANHSPRSGTRQSSVGGPAPPASQSTAVSGRVLDPDGRPVAGAKLYLKYDSRKGTQYAVRATSGDDGRFRFTFDRAKLDPPPADPDEPWLQVLALAQGHGPDWEWLEKPDRDAELTLRLVKDLPIEGRILDVGGKPVAAATLRVQTITAYSDVDAFLQTVRDRKWPLVTNKSWFGPFPGQPKLLTTGADGRFRLEGVGRDREVQFHLEGPGIAYGPVRALARPMQTAVEPQDRRREGPVIHKVHGAAFAHVAAPSRLIRGVVRDKKTGKPVAGVEVSAAGTTQRTDQDGRYELRGVGKSTDGYFVSFSPAGQPYFTTGVSFPDTLGLEPIQGDVELVGGISVHGRLTHAVTGKPIASARVDYNPLYPNPFVGRLLGPQGARFVPCSTAVIRPDGTYTLVVLPGPGVLGFRAGSSKELFMPALLTKQELRDFLGHDEDYNNEDSLKIQGGENSFTAISQREFSHLLLIKPPEKSGPLTHDVVLRPAQKLRGKVVGPDGKPLVGVKAFHLAPGIFSQPLEDDTFAVQGLNPKRARHLLFVHKDKNLAAAVEVRGEVKDPLTVRLEPCASVAGRLLDADGQPAANAVVRAEPPGWLWESDVKVRCDREGRFRIDGLVPGLKYQVRHGPGPFGQYLFNCAVKPGESKDLGEARLKPPGN